MFKRTIALVLAVLMAVTALAGCGGPTETPQEQTSGGNQPSSVAGSSGSTVSAPPSGMDELIVATKAEIQSVNPFIVGVWAVSVASLINDSLTERVVDGSVGPALATSWENTDELTWVFQIREGGKFTNGEVVNAKLLEDTFQFMLTLDATSPEWVNTNVGDILSVTESMVATGEYELTITTKMPFPSYPIKMTMMRPLPLKDIEERGIEEAMNTTPLSCGPYKLVSFERGGECVLEANPDYVLGEPAIKKLTFTVILDPASRVAALEAGDVHLINGLPFTEIERLRQNDKFIVNVAPTTFTYFMQFSYYGHEALRDIRVRQALSMALDMDVIVDDVLDGNAGKISTPTFNPSNEGYDPSIKRLPYDPERAKELLKEAGYENGLRLTMSINPGAHVGSGEASQVMKQMWAQIGVDVEIREVESGLLSQQYQAKETADLVCMGLGGTQGDGSLVTRMAFEKGERYSAYEDEDLRALRLRVEATMDTAERQKLQTQLQQYAIDQAIGVGLWQMHEGWAYIKNLKGFKPYVTTLVCNLRSCSIE